MSEMKVPGVQRIRVGGVLPQYIRAIAGGVAIALLLGGGALVCPNGRGGTGASSPAEAVSWVMADAERIGDDVGKFSFVVPHGWKPSEDRKLTYGTTLLTNPATPDGVILLGPLDLKLFASSYPDNRKAAIRLASDMGTFLTPYPGRRINGEDGLFESDGLPAAFACYETRYDDPGRENGQMWAAVIGNAPFRIFLLWRGTQSSPIDRVLAQALAESVQMY